MKEYEDVLPDLSDKIKRPPCSNCDTPLDPMHTLDEGKFVGFFCHGCGDSFIIFSNNR